MTDEIVSKSPLSEEEQKGLLDTMEMGEAKLAVMRGDYYIAGPGKDAGKPVLRWAKGPSRGRIAPGSGRIPNAANIGEIAKRTAYKKTNAWHDLMEHAMPAEADASVKGSLAWMLEKGYDMVEGGDVKKDVICPECNHKFQIVAWKKGDSTAWFKLMEFRGGRATERKEIDITVRNLMEMLDEHIDTSTFEVYEVTPEEVARKKLLASGIRDDS